MTSVLVDSNVLIDILTDDPVWHSWSDAALLQAGNGRQLVINPIIYAEVSAYFDRIEEIEVVLPAADFSREDIPYDAAFLAGKAFIAYRKRGGVRRSPLPDFFIGAHALVADYALLTRDAARYRTYFPKLQLISP